MVLALWHLLRLLLSLPLLSELSAPAAISALLSFSYIAASYRLRSGSLAAAGWIYLISTWLVRTAGIGARGGAHPFSIAAYLALPVSAAWLLGPRIALVGTSLSTAVLYGSVWLQHLGAPLSAAAPFALDPASAFFEALVIATLPIVRIVQNVEAVLLRSRAAEQALQQYQAGLEKLVRQRTAELEVARDDALAASRAKSVFLITVSHELRSPLNTILLLSDPDWIDPTVSEAARRDLNLIRRSGESLLHLIDDVLESAGIDPGHITLHNATFDFVELLHEVMDLMQMRAAEKSLDFSVESSPDLPRFVTADAAKLRHVLVNLMDDAIRYTKSGHVQLRAHAHTVDETGLLRLSFEIGDTGDPARDNSGIGTDGSGALSLSMTRQYLLVMGGSVRVESVSGGGSRICVDVPAALGTTAGDGHVTRPAPRIVALTPGQSECRVLIVEDQLEDRLLLRRMLQDAGFRVQAAESGESAIEVFPSWKPHFVWVDRRLPLMDGLQATQRIRMLEGGGDVIIAGLGNSLFPSEREEMLAAGVHDFVRKPFRPDEIFDCMARHLDLRYEYAAARHQTA
jgi:signal transduction histidine kinase/CheY-like chemotaxis protein